MASSRALVAAGCLAAVKARGPPIRFAAAAVVAAAGARLFATRGPTAQATATATRTQTITEEATARQGEAESAQTTTRLVAVPDRLERPVSSSSAAASLARDEAPQAHAAPSPGVGGELFTPRTEYEAGTGTVRSHFPGHHRAALTRMRRDLGHIGLIIECRDLRVPLTSWNPVLEAALMLPTGAGGGGGVVGGGAAGTDGSPIPGLAGPFPSATAAPLASGKRTHILVYTKRDLVVDGAAGGGPSRDDPLSPTSEDLRRLADFHRRRGGVDAVVFLGADEKSSSSSSSSSVAFTARGRRETSRLLASVRAAARRHGAQALTDLRALVVGLPNAGKSTLLNRLRARGMADPQRRGRAARTGAQAGVTRKMGTPVRVLEEAASAGGPAAAGSAPAGPQNGVLLYDTPGVSLPYVADPESMLKLALVGSVREGLVPAVQLADYLLFQLNRHAAQVQAEAAAQALAAPPADGEPAALSAPAAAAAAIPPSPSPAPGQQSDTPMQAFEGAVTADAVTSALAKLKLAAAATGTALVSGNRLQMQQQQQQHWPPYVAAYGLPRPTEDVHVLLDAVARRSGKLLRGGAPDHAAAALQFVYAWRHGRLGRFCLDDLSADGLAAAAARQQAHREAAPRSLSLNQARNREKARRKAAAAAKRGRNPS